MKENDKSKQFNNNNNLVEDTTDCEEFICSYFAWLDLDKQKEIAEDLEDIAEQKENKSK